MKMKSAILSLLAVLLLSGCAAGYGGTLDTPPATTMPVPITAPPISSGVLASEEHAEDYFPAIGNVRYAYEGVGNEYASYTAYPVFFSENRLQMRVDNGGTVVAKVYKWESGRLTLVLSREASFVRENLLDTPEQLSDILIQEPLMMGTSWAVTDGLRTITGVDVPVTTPAGNYHALEVTTQGKDTKTINYYAKGTGLVKSVFQSGETEISSSLSEFKQDMPFMQTVRLFYPGAKGTGRYYRDVPLTMPTNVTLAAVLEEAYKMNPGDQAALVFTPRTRILSLSLNEQDMAVIDLSQEFILERTPAGAAYESNILQSVADTIGSIFMTGKVLITVEGTPYKSENISMTKGEPIAVSTEDAMMLAE